MNKEKARKDKNENERTEKTEVIRPSQSNLQKKQKLEHGGPKGLEPTRYGDWERKGRCIDF